MEGEVCFIIIEITDNLYISTKYTRDLKMNKLILYQYVYMNLHTFANVILLFDRVTIYNKSEIKTYKNV